MTRKLLTGETRAAEGIVRVLEEAGIDMVFGIAGGNMGRLYDALYDHQGTVRTVLVRHEQLASVMAEVYGRLTGKPGVAIGQRSETACFSVGSTVRVPGLSAARQKYLT